MTPLVLPRNSETKPPHDHQGRKALWVVGGQIPACISSGRISRKVNTRRVTVELSNRHIYRQEGCLPASSSASLEYRQHGFGEHDKSREATGVEADCPCQATRCLAKPIGWETFQCRDPYLGLKSRLQGAHMTSLSRKRQNRGTTLPHHSWRHPAPHLHSQQAVCDGECERNSQQYCRAPDAFPPRHPQRSVRRDHGHLSHTGALPAVQGSGPRPSSAGGNPRRADGDAHLLPQHHQ